MSDYSIKVENLSKRYHIGEGKGPYRTFREVLAGSVKAPFKKATRLLKGQAYGAAGLEEELWALSDVSFEVKQGEVLGIIGRNGAGKTTLLKVLSKITEPTKGRVEIHGRIGSLLEVGIGMHPELTGRENLYLNGAIYNMKKAEIDRKFDEIVEFSGVGRFLETPLKHYSSGMQVRLAFSIAAHLEPEILLVDEVLAVGDVGFQRKCMSKMEEVSYGGRTVIFVSHNMEAIKGLCQRGILLDNGKVSYEGDISSTIEKYLGNFGTKVGKAEISKRDHAVDSGLLCINEVYVKDSKGKQTAGVNYREDFTIGMKVSIYGHIEKGRIGIGINNPGGFRISTTHHTDMGAKPLTTSSGCYKLEAAFKNNLQPGIYEISVGANEELSGKILDFIPEAINLLVSNVSEDKFIRDSANKGLIDMEVAWTEAEIA